MSSIWTVVTIIEALWVTGLAAWIILERRSPVATLAWILTLAWLPAVGILVYYFIGPRRLQRRRMKRAHSTKLVQSAIETIEDETGDPTRAEIARLVVRAGEAAPLHAERVDLYTEGKECFDAQLAAIAAAKHHVHLTYYIWYPDAVGTRFRDALIAKAKEGVEVRLLLDWIGAYPTSKRFLAPLEQAGGKVAWFNPVTLTRLRPRYTNFRTHRKIVVCDGTVGFTGGMNISDEQTVERYADRAWRDTHIRVEGAAVRSLQRVFIEDWHYATGEIANGPQYLKRANAKLGDTRHEHLVQIVASGPDGDMYAVHKLFFASIASAHQRVRVTTPYFVPDEAIVSALVTAAMRGVAVELIVPAAGDSLLVDLAARSYFPELLVAGVKIYEYLPRFIHAKTIVIDGDLSIVGSANIDNRSFRLNFEICAAVYGQELAAKLSAAFDDDLAECREVKSRQLERESLVRRLGESTARLLSPML
ncbi:MAG: cardiolipin synthase [Myxococcota bacterium]|nr:cardiolipin synthase [Myxococcota bacterium]